MSLDAKDNGEPMEYKVFWTHTTRGDLDLGDLRNEVHPIFAKYNFPGTDEDYANYLPSLRLASLLLVRDGSLERLRGRWIALTLLNPYYF